MKDLSCRQSAILLAAFAVSFSSILSHAAEPEPAVPTIDMHTHTFNAKYLPVGGIARSYTSTVVGVDTATAALMRVIDYIVRALTAESSLCGKPASQPGTASFEPMAKAQGLTAPHEIELRAKVQGLNLLEQHYEELAKFVEVGDVKGVMAAGPQVKAGLVERALVKALVEPLTQEDSDATDLGGKDPLRLVWLLLKSEEQIVQTLRQDYPEVDLFVHHMMDLQKAHGDREPYFKFREQICRAKDLDERMNRVNFKAKGQLLHFVAYDPFRGAKAMALVKEGMSNGAVGVKFYPPNGYRAAHNEIPPSPNWWRSSTAWKFWRAKYAKLDDARLDRATSDLFSFCETNRIPVFAHCTPVGFQAVRGYGTNCNPCYWEMALQEHPNLILCLGHAGGSAWWTATNATGGKYSPMDCDAPYGERVVELCLRYPNVFCEMAHLEEVLSTQGQDRIRGKLAQVLDRPSVDGSWKFGDKVMYGTDWHMMYSFHKRQEYLAQFRKIFDDGPLKPWRGKFFAGNAAKYLNLEAQIKNDHLSLETREGLRTLLMRIPN